MDGITDAPFRFIIDKYGKPDVIFTEFVSVDGLAQGRLPVFDGLIRNKTNTSIVAQLIGSDPDKFYLSTIIALTLGFDGIDINMGCPDKSVNFRGGGAALINEPKLTCQIINSVKKAVSEKHLVPISVKTRLGYHSVDLDWFKTLLERDPDAIIIHGRTFDQRFHGQADWDSIGKVVELAKNTKTKIIGNGDVKNRKDALGKIKEYHVDGVLIGRACRGNPWVFTDHESTIDERKKIMIEHCEKFLELLPDRDFNSLRKHMAWYCKDFPGSASIRNQLTKINNLKDVEEILKQI